MGELFNLMVSCDTVTVDDHIGEVVRSAEEGLPDPDQVLGPLAIQGYSGPYPCMDEEVPASDGGEG